MQALPWADMLDACSMNPAASLLTLSVLAGLAVPALAHPGHEGDDPGAFVFASFTTTSAQSTASAAKGNQVSITAEGGKRVVRSNGVPDHTPGQFPNRGNPHTISAQSYEFRMPLKPQAASTPAPARGAWFGVAVNGVPFEPGTAEFWNGDPRWVYEALGGFINLGLDKHNAHVQPSGAYHYHALPTGLVSSMGGDGKSMRLLGWAADGFPIYSAYAPADADDLKSPLKKMRSSYQLLKDARPGGPGGRADGRFSQDFEYVPGSGDLDECNGRTGVTPEYPQGTFYYCITDDFPWISRFWHGTPDPSFSKRGGGPPGGGGRGQGPGAGPRRGGGPLGPPGPPPPLGPPPPFGPPMAPPPPPRE